MIRIRRIDNEVSHSTYINLPADKTTTHVYTAFRYATYARWGSNWGILQATDTSVVALLFDTTRIFFVVTGP